MVRNIQIYGWKGKEFTGSKAIHMLTKEGMETSGLHLLLGLSLKNNHIQRFTKRHLTSLARKRSALLYSANHVVVVSDGYYDDYGKAIRLGDTIPILENAPARSWLELK
jgi:hypothetical protein